MTMRESRYNVLSTLVTSSARRKLLVRFFTHPGERFYTSQLIRELGLASSAAQKELARLEDAGLIASEREGNARFYQVNTRHPLYPELKSIIYKTAGLGDVIRARLQEVGGVEAALVYGSVARGVEDAASDVDLLVIGDVAPDSLDGALLCAEESLGREVNATVLSPAEWRERLSRGQAFATDIMNGPKIYVIGGDDDSR